MNIYQVYYRPNSNVEINLIIVAPNKDAVIEYCFEDHDEEIARENFYVTLLWSSEKEDSDRVKQIYRHSEEQR